MATSEAIWADIERRLAECPVDIRGMRAALALQTLYRPQQAPREVAKFALDAICDDVRATIGNEPITYLEFGVYSGASMRRMLDRFTDPGARFYGFDSFQGLPEDWVLPWNTMERGTFSTLGRVPDIADPRVEFVKGWFQNTLPQFLDAPGRNVAPPVLVHYDADLYSSTLFILTTLWHKIPEYYFMFDEFLDHEVIALHDFSQAYPVEIEFFCQTRPGELPEQVFGRLKRIPLTVEG